MRLNIQILNKFIEWNSLSAFRLYAFVQNKFNGHLHANDFKQISKELGISSRTILQNLKQLQYFKVCGLYAKGYWRFNTWNNWAPVNKNRIIDIDIDKLKSLKYVRSLFYLCKYKSSWQCARQNTKERAKGYASGFVPVSASFVKAVTGVSSSVQTLLKHLKRGKDLKLVDYQPSSLLFITSTSIEYLKLAQKYITLPSSIKKVRNFYQLFTFEPHLVNFKTNFQ